MLPSTRNIWYPWTRRDVTVAVKPSRLAQRNQLLEPARLASIVDLFICRQHIHFDFPKHRKEQKPIMTQASGLVRRTFSEVHAILNNHKELLQTATFPAV